jgi:hypothetical protein
MQDLFEKKTKIEKLEEWMKEKKRFTTSQVIMWGCQNYLSSANRRKQELYQSGKIRPLTEYEKFSWGFKGKDKAYCWVDC